MNTDLKGFSWYTIVEGEFIRSIGPYLRFINTTDLKGCRLILIHKQ